MEFTNSTYIVIGVCLGGCFVVPLIVSFFLPFIPTSPLDFLFFLRDQEYRREEKEYKNLVTILKERGVTAPADILDINFTGRSRTKPGWHVGIPPKEREFQFTVNVFPENRESFRAEFSQYVDNIYDEYGNLPGKILVLYDPMDLGKVIFHSVANDGINERRAEFNRLADLNNQIRNIGEEAEAVITMVEDLGLDYPNKNGRAKRIFLRVTPKSGASFNSETHALIVYTATEKYSEGKKVFVKFIPGKPERVALDSERNKLIS